MCCSCMHARLGRQDRCVRLRGVYQRRRLSQRVYSCWLSQPDHLDDEENNEDDNGEDNGKDDEEDEEQMKGKEREERK